MGIDTPDSSSPACDAERLYFGIRSARINGPLYALAAGASGSLAPQEGESALAGQAWQTASSAPGLPSPVSANGQVFTLSGGFLACFDAASGQPRFKERLEGTGVIVASPIVSGAHLVVVGESGKAVVLAARPEFEVLGGGELDDLFWATPAVAGDALLPRGAEHLYCLRARGSAPAGN